MINTYAEYLAAAGLDTFEVEGHFWQRYKGVMMPAYLPHTVPVTIAETAHAALKLSGAPLARWTEHFDGAPCSEWWYVLRDGVYSKQELSSNTRSKLNRGGRRLEARLVSPDAILRDGYAVCVAATQRHRTGEFLPERLKFERLVQAAKEVPTAVEYWGVYRGNSLVAFSENHLQDNALFMESIWYDPDGLRDYSSYVLMDAILEEYLGNRDFKYVSDGSRSIYHETGVHDFLIDKFGFRRARSQLQLAYRPIFGAAVQLARALMPVISIMPHSSSLRTVRRAQALVLQDQISRKGENCATVT